MTIGMLACKSDYIHANFKGEILSWMLKAMELNTNDLVLQEVLCNAAANLSDDANKCKMLIEQGAVSVVIKVLKMFPESSKITYSSLYFWDNAAKESNGMKMHLLIIFLMHVFVGLSNHAGLRSGYPKKLQSLFFP